MPLKGIPTVISPELLDALYRAGHGDEIVLADIHFPASSICRSGPKEIRADGHSIPVLLEAIMKLFPLDQYVPQPVALMELVSEDKARSMKTPVWDIYKTILEKAEQNPVNIEMVERFAFYNRAKEAFAIVHTGETAQYGNIILKKGLVSFDTSSTGNDHLNAK